MDQSVDADAASRRAILFFDGSCGLCNRLVAYLFERDKRHCLRFAPLQGVTAQAWLTERERTCLDTVILAIGARRYQRSTAILQALAMTGGIRRPLAYGLLVVPRPLRDLGYLCVASNRYRIFGKAPACRLPRPEDLRFFLA